MEGNTTEMIHHIIYLVVFVCGLGMIVGRLSKLLKLPDVALFLLAGIVAGPVMKWIMEPSSSVLNQLILTGGAALILFDGGRNIRLEGLKKVWITVAMLSVPGVIITGGAVAVAAHYLLSLDWIYALLLGAIISSTDPATLIPVFKQVKILPKVRETVESESAFNDATGSILTFSVLAVILGTSEISLASGLLDFVKTAVGGIVVGGVVGYVTAYLVGHTKFGGLRDYTAIAMMLTALSAYLIGDELHVSGFMATFVAGLIWGNAKLFKLDMSDKSHEMDHVAENITVIMRMLIFVLLGSQVDFGVISEYLFPSLAVILIFMLIARPITVLLCALPDRRAKWKRNELVFMFWVRETGVIPAALSGMIAGTGIQHADVIAAVTFMAVLLTILIQASTTGIVAKKLGLEIRPDKKQAGSLT